jgi:hypothetical protein
VGVTFVQLPRVLVIGDVVVAVPASRLLAPMLRPATQQPQWCRTSPFNHIPKAPAANITSSHR